MEDQIKEEIEELSIHSQSPKASEQVGTINFEAEISENNQEADVVAETEVDKDKNKSNNPDEEEEEDFNDINNRVTQSADRASVANAQPRRSEHRLSINSRRFSQREPAQVEKPFEPTKRMIITQMVLENFKSYAGVQVIGPFHKVLSVLYFHHNFY
jgi:structural maintenance of chromosome 4